MVFIYCNTVDPFFLNFRGFGLWSCVIIGLFHDSRSDRGTSAGRSMSFRLVNKVGHGQLSEMNQ